MSEDEEPKAKIMKITPTVSCASTARTSTKIPPTCDSEESFVMDTCNHDSADIRNLPAFVDKNLLLEEVLKNVPRILLFAKRRLGKSVHISMLKQFFEILVDPEVLAANRKLSEGFLIEQYKMIMEEHRGKHPVVFLKLEGSGLITSYEDASEMAHDVVHAFDYESDSELESNEKLSAAQKRILEKWDTLVIYPRKLRKLFQIWLKLSSNISRRKYSY